MSKTSDADICLTSFTLPETEEDSWSYESANLLEQKSDSEEWLNKSKVHYSIATDYIEESMISPEPDPFLNEVNQAENSPINLEQFSDCETYPLSNLPVKNIQTEKSKKAARTRSTKGKRSKTTKTLPREADDAKASFVNSSKCDLLQNDGETGSYVELLQEDETLMLHVKDSNGKEIVPFHYILSAEVGGQVEHPFIHQNISVVSSVELSPELNIQMPKLQTEQGLRLFLCPIQECRKAFIQFASAKLHALSHLEHKPYKCNFPNCRWAFYTPFKLRRHKETHSKRKDFVCDVPGCARRFTTIYNLSGHKRLHDRPANLPCPVKKCNKMFQTIRGRQLHLRSHRRSEASLECSASNCNKKFFTQTALLTHLKSHSHKESELVCQWPECGKVFEQPYRLKEHQRIHTGQRPYCCLVEDCKWSFPTASKLRRHQSTHTNDRKFHCTIGTCSKSFLRSEHLKDHTLTHIAQRTIVCDGKNFTYLILH